ncbi:TPA: hypothetical protein ACNV3W_005347, partial [Raoultella ornithinolytica]
IIRTPTTSLKTSIKTITNLSDTNCLEIHGASLSAELRVWFLERYEQYCKQALSERETDARETGIH